jgi:hypothetical protein
MPRPTLPVVDGTPIVNPLDVDAYSTHTLYRFSFGSVDVLAWACHTLDDALEEAADWLRDNAPGVFSEPDYEDAATELGAPEDWREDDEWCERVRDAAETDHTYTEAGWLLSWEWHVSDVTDADEFSRAETACRDWIEADDD